jgi:predicted RNA methylase
MLKLAEVKPGDTVYDLGSGDGRVIIDAARLFGANAVGIEIDFLRFLWTKVKIIYLGLSGKVNILHGNFFNIDISSADVVTIYLLQETNIKLTYKFISELRPGTRIVSNTFTLPGLRIISSDEKDKIYVYII